MSEHWNFHDLVKQAWLIIKKHNCEYGYRLQVSVTAKVLQPADSPRPIITLEYGDDLSIMRPHAYATGTNVTEVLQAFERKIQDLAPCH